MKNDNEKMEVGLFTESKLKTYCSKLANTLEEKKELFNALEKCDVLLNDIVGQTIYIKDVYCEEKEFIDNETGEAKTKYRTILFDVDGKTYATGSYGIFNVLNKLINIYGLPTNWTEPLKVTVAKKPIGNGKSALTFTL